jgi:hypothetical protein
MGRITGVRGDTVVREPSVVGDQNGTSAEHAQEILANELVNLAAKTFDTSRPVDEYQSVTSALTLEVLPEYEMDELIEAIVVVANPFTTSAANPGSQNQSNGTVGTQATPAAGTTITSQAVGAGTYTVQWSVQISTATATLANNFGLYNGATLVATSMNSLAVGTYPQPPVTMVLSAGATIAIKAIASETTATYVAQLITTLAQTPGNVAVPNVVTLQLGRRLWNIQMSDSGIVTIDGLGLRLNRNERRVLTQTVAGPLSLELTGHADMSGT